MAGQERGEAGRQGEAAETFDSAFLIVDDFLPAREALALREAIDDHFAEPHKHVPERHQVWNYWHVPDLYTYLRTRPEKLIPDALVRRFHEALSVFGQELLGLGRVSWPNLSLYVDGCGQQLHNDSANGRLGFVYSLTRDSRKTVGGETLVLREGDLFRANLGRAAAGSGLYELIAPRFNRLILFDDRIPHGVRRVEGPMDPLEGRFVLHGHVSEGGAGVDGPLAADLAAERLRAAAAPVLAEAAAEGQCHGPLGLRIRIGADGRVLGVERLLDRVMRADGGSARGAVDAAIAALGTAVLPAADAPSVVTLPILFGPSIA